MKTKLSKTSGWLPSYPVLSPNSLRLLPLATFCILLFTQCHSGIDKGIPGPEDELYRESVRISRLYTDSLLNAKDSASVIRLMADYEDAITKANYKYPADTYINIAESDNDTLTRMSLRIVSIRDSILYSLAHPMHPADTVPESENTDSI